MPHFRAHFVPSPGVNDSHLHSSSSKLSAKAHQVMIAPKAEIPLYHHGRESSRASFSRRRRPSTSSRRRGGGNACWYVLIVSPLVLVAFCLGTFFGMELAHAPTKGTGPSSGACCGERLMGKARRAGNTLLFVRHIFGINCCCVFVSLCIVNLLLYASGQLSF